MRREGAGHQRHDPNAIEARRQAHAIPQHLHFIGVKGIAARGSGSAGVPCALFYLEPFQPSPLANCSSMCAADGERRTAPSLAHQAGQGSPRGPASSAPSGQWGSLCASCHSQVTPKILELSPCPTAPAQPADCPGFDFCGCDSGCT